MKKKWCYLWLLLCLFGISCQKETAITEKTEGQYEVYYVNQSGTALLRTLYETETKDPKELVEELLLQCSLVPEGEDGRRAIPENVTMEKSPTLENRIVNICFDSSYYSMDQVTALFCRAAIAKTLTQVKGVDYVALYIDGSPYTGEGTTVQYLSGGDFVDNTGDATNQYEKTYLTLFFANKGGNELIKEEREVVYLSNLPIERVILTQLIAGPQNHQLSPTVPAGVKVQSVSIRDGICYVDFDSNFLNETANVTAQVEIYSIVNSLVENSDVKCVQISVNGSSEVSFRNSIPLAERLEGDRSLVGTLEDPKQEIPETLEETSQETETGGETFEDSQEETRELPDRYFSEDEIEDIS